MRKTNLLLSIMRFALLCLSLILFVQPAQAESFFQKGICYVTWEKERYASAYSDKSLEMLAKNTGAEWIALVTTYYQEKFDSKEIFPTENTPSDKSLIHIINKAHQLGIKVMLKPHIDLLDQSDGLWRADIGFQTPADWQEWFSQYLKFILHYAELAEKSNAEIFCVGTELSFAAQQAIFWQRDVIPQVRKVYKGELIYAANWDEYKNIRFWKEVDYVGIDAYFPIVERRNPGYEEIEGGWRKWADEIEQWQKTINKPIVFTEIGYRSCVSAAERPWEFTLSEELDLEIQADCYRAALSVIFNRSWCKGIYWWYWKPSIYAGGLNNRDFTPQNKPAEIVLESWYKGLDFVQLSR